MEFIKYYKKYIIGGLCFLLVLGGSLYFYLKEERSVTSLKSDDILLSDSSNLTKEEEKNEDNIIYVDVKGAVKKPGVYELTSNDKVIDAINKAGGIKSTGTTDNINLSKKLSNEMVVYIFTKKELAASEKQNVTESVPCKCETIVVDNCINKEENTISSDENKTSSDSNKKININTASKEELITISGIGEAKAESIIKYREENGAFKQIEDITKVSGLGESIFNKIKEFITV